jgi:hypothetical protein
MIQISSPIPLGIASILAKAPSYPRRSSLPHQTTCLVGFSTPTTTPPIPIQPPTSFDCPHCPLNPSPQLAPLTSVVRHLQKVQQHVTRPRLPRSISKDKKPRQPRHLAECSVPLSRLLYWIPDQHRYGKGDTLHPVPRECYYSFQFSQHHYSGA